MRLMRAAKFVNLEVSVSSGRSLERFDAIESETEFGKVSASMKVLRIEICGEPAVV